MSDCLHCDIHDLLENHLEADDANMAEIASKVTEVLADLILMVPPTDRTMLMADVIANLGAFVIEKNEEMLDDTQPPRRLGRH
jgi:hypothetical protein